ncbi:MAG: outer membrane receptor protein involved in Fe transport [Halioglobus sp.]|jgi:iron complex outermembrane receptor protein
MLTRSTIIAVLATAISLPLHSQEQNTEQVLVTATSTSVNAQDLALAWSVVDAEAIDMVNHIHINEIMQQVPGAWISRGNGQESLSSLRSPVLTGAGGCGAIFVASDGISLRAPGFCNVNQLFDANAEQAGRIEVIKGPGTALYGSNAMHGVINILSAAPPQSPDNTIAIEAGPYDYYRAKYRYGNTSGEHGISVRANATSDGGYKDDSGYDQQKLTLRHDYQSDRWAVTTVLNAANLNQETSGFVQGEEAYNDNALKQSNPNPEAYRDARSLLLYSRIDYTFNDHNVVTFTPYVRDNEMAFLQHFLPWQSTEENGHSSVGVRTFLTTTSESMQWVNGVDLEYTDGWLKETQDEEFSPNQPVGTHYDYQVDATVAAAYSQLSGDFGDRWSFTAGARFESTQYDYDNSETNGSACAPGASNCRFFRPADREDSFSEWSLNAGSSYQLGERQFVYLRAAQGFRAPQATELYRLQSGQTVADLDSENIDSVEIGLRGLLFDSLVYDFSAYNMEKENVIFQDANRQNVSGAKTRHAGIDVALDYALSDNWSVRLDATYAEHKYDSPTQLLGSSGDIKGNYIDTAPKIFGSAGLSWDMTSTTGMPGTAELEWVYMDSYYLEPDNEHEYEGHSLLNLRISSQITQRLSAGVRLSNLLDEEYAERADFGFGNYRYFVGQPMGAYFEVEYQFGG